MVRRKATPMFVTGKSRLSRVRRRNFVSSGPHSLCLFHWVFVPRPLYLLGDSTQWPFCVFVLVSLDAGGGRPCRFEFSDTPVHDLFYTPVCLVTTVAPTKPLPSSTSLYRSSPPTWTAHEGPPVRLHEYHRTHNLSLGPSRELRTEVYFTFYWSTM